MILACGLFQAEDNWGSADSGKAFYLPFNRLKEFGWGPVSRRELLSWIILYIRKIYLYDMGTIFTQHLLFPSSYELSFFPLKPQGPTCFFFLA